MKKEVDSLKLVRIDITDAHKLWEMQVEAFNDLYQRYQDTETSPAAENVDRIIMRLQQPFTYYYYIQENGENVGAVRVVDKREKGTPKRISPIFIMPEYRNHGIAQKTILAVEELHGRSDWELATILQEKGNCYLYEKMGYHQTGKTEIVNDKMTLVFYKKD